MNSHPEMWMEKPAAPGRRTENALSQSLTSQSRSAARQRPPVTSAVLQYEKSEFRV
jgi:hypothetical protein